MMATLNDFFVVDGVNDVSAAGWNKLLGATLRAEYRNVQTIAATKTLTNADTPIQRLTPSGANRDVSLPTVATTNHPFFIVNPTGTSYNLVVKSGATTLVALGAGESVLVFSDGAGWTVYEQQTKDGWLRAQSTWTYSSADSPSFVITVPDLDAALIGVGWRVRLNQSGTKYFIVTAKGSSVGGNTPLTVYGGTDYTLANAAISDVRFSSDKAPMGFPLSPAKWTVTASDATDRTKTSPSTDVWYNAMDSGNLLSIVLPIGEWVVSYKCIARVQVAAGSTYVRSDVTLSTSTSSVSDADFTITNGFNPGAATTTALAINSYLISLPKAVAVAAKTTYYLLIKSIQPADNLQLRGASSTTMIKAVCAYL